MLGYYLHLALKSFRRNPGLTAVMVGAIALGIAVCVVTLTVYHAMSGNPIWWKNDRLYAVTMDLWDPQKPANPRHPELPPAQMSYNDATAIAASGIPERSVVMFREEGVVTGGSAQRKPLPAATRMTTADFFSMFEVPFLYGSGWNAAADSAPEPLIVLSKKENERLFGGVNSVGRTLRWNDQPFRVVGVLDDWFPVPKFFDVTTGAFGRPEDVYIPLRWGMRLELAPNGGSTDCWALQEIHSYRDFLNSDCVWLQMWVELPSAASRARMQSFMDAYWADQHRAGRFLRPRNNRLTPVDQWLIDNDVVDNDNRVFVGMACAFLAVCLINTVGILLARFLGRAPVTGVRRALGASRRDVFVQHLVEVGAVAIAGACCGLLLAVVGLWGLHALYAAPERGGYQELAHFDNASILWAIALAAASAAAAGLYPAWRIGRMPPAAYLKSQ